METAAIFVVDMEHLAGNEKCFGCRFGVQKLPKGSYVVGFMVVQGGEIIELLSKPYTQPTQEKSWEDTLAYARAVLTEDYDAAYSLEEAVL